ncbi:hypothetical protein chiPu_0015907 [Chiloscyllium punctatum]|uniref:Dynactin subunit 3 n=1 Tax=Chiloscyllium punctatum TaxID=137246 RepID=A0A401T408_CHIPU|nr:hypothetical protein [Chiloscyllium punctatum]
MAELKRLQNRLEKLETRLYGERGRQAGQFTDGIVKVQAALGNISSKRERIKTLYKKIDDLIKYLDPQYIDRIAIPDAMKLEFILAEEHFIHSQVRLLESVKKHQPYLESEHIKAVPNYSSKFDLDNDLQILLLSKQFVQWEELLTKLEAAKQMKPIAD